jgi:uncharacterized protein YqgC (DUF456 family)
VAKVGESLDTIALVIALFVVLIGVIGTVVPVIPGTILIFLAALGYAIVEGFQSIGWPTLVVLGILAAVATTADIWASSVGAKAGGASYWSVLAGLAGGLIGFVVLNLPGAIAGAILGVLATEMMRLKDWRQALKAGGGWLAGWLLATVVQLVIGLTMAAIFVWQVALGA